MFDSEAATKIETSNDNTTPVFAEQANLKISDAYFQLFLELWSLAGDLIRSGDKKAAAGLLESADKCMKRRFAVRDEVSAAINARVLAGMAAQHGAEVAEEYAWHMASIVPAMAA